MSVFIHPAPWMLACIIAALNVPLGRLRANAQRRSHRRFGLLAASAFLLLALRHAFDLAWIEALPLVGAMLAGQFVGRRAAAKTDVPADSRWRTAVYAALLAGLLLFVGAPAHAHEHEHTHAPAADAGKWERLEADEPAPAFSLIDQNGRRVALSDLRGKVVIATFLYTSCTDVCPVLAQKLARVDEMFTKTEQAKYRIVGISVDPLRDKPRTLKKFLRDRELAESRWTLLTGTEKELTRVADDYGVVVRPDPHAGLVHNTVFVFIDERGHLRTELHGLATPNEEIAGALRELIAERK